MIKYLPYEEKYQDQMYDVFNELTKEEVFFKKLTKEEFSDKLFKNPNFKKEGTFLALEGDKLVGFASGSVKDTDKENPNASGYIHTFIVRKEYRRQGIGSKLYDMLEKYFKDNGRNSARFVFLSGICWPWYIPHTEKHEHPGMPAARMNSDFYLFLYHHGYFVNSIHEGFHLPLSEYELPEKVVKQEEENAKRGLFVEIYDPKKHYGIDEFCEVINNPGFAHSIQYNLKRDEPRPFLVAAHNNKVVGWTGAMYTEATGRGHLDGICVDLNERGGGLGKGLFCHLCKYLKDHGSTYMTFFTGIDNPARYIYLFAGFKIVQSFADMKKNF
jgi:acetyltransferase, GNAT family